MKTIFTLLITIAAFTKLSAQAILNEVYAFPGGSRNEFFEFYNNSVSAASMDNYTLVTYYESGSEKGFFVLDLPNVTVVPRGYFVGSSSIPFNYQGASNSTNSDYSWNDLAFMSTNNGYLRQWKLSTIFPAAIDGNANYDMVPVPANFNDIFQKIGGGSATYNVFVYNNGVLQSIFLGGTGGNTFIPNYITSLPTLHVDMTGTSPDFDINFSTYGNAKTEYVTQDIGSDNGYIRLVDGYCGTWTKSSSQITHTPGVTNGGTASLSTATVGLSLLVNQGTAATGSKVTYDVMTANASDFPITMNVYIDNGSVAGKLDAGDTFLDSKIETTLTDGPFTTVFFPYNASVLVQTITSAGCIDAVRYFPNFGVLPVRFTDFDAASIDKKTELKWQVVNNESSKQFEIERSVNGKDFAPIALILTTQRKGSETYSFKDGTLEGKAFYRIKLTDNNDKIFYTNILAVENLIRTPGKILINQNPIESYLTFRYNSKENSQAAISIRNASGAVVYTQKTSISPGTNSIAINLDGKIFAGLYVLELKTSYDQQSIKFIKQ